MEPRTNKEQSNRRERQVHVPQRPGVSLRGAATGPVQNKPVIPLLDEEKRDLKTPVFIEHMRRVSKKIANSPKKSAVVILLLVAIGYTGTQLMQEKTTITDIKGATVTTVPNQTGLERNAKPDFSTVVPQGKTINDLGGWTRISPKDRTPVYAYADKLNNVTIRVSEQQLPANLEGNSDELQKLATSFNAGQKLTIGDITAFVGTSAKGPQSVIFAKDKLLILITSDQKIDTDHWTTYIGSLR